MVTFESALGWLGIAYSPAGLAGVILPCSSAEDVQQAVWAQFPEARPAPAEDAPDRIVKQLQRYAAGERVTFHVALDWSQHTPFRQSVWRTTLGIPYGETRSYQWVAQEIGRPRAARAVGQALAANPMPIVVPCHRVLASDGGLAGFGGGLDMKRRLLALEQADP
jgi:O-6-methylguanine DNA methyltransferase